MKCLQKGLRKSHLSLAGQIQTLDRQWRHEEQSKGKAGPLMTLIVARLKALVHFVVVKMK